jgi:hypothetical protein
MTFATHVFNNSSTGHTQLASHMVKHDATLCLISNTRGAPPCCCNARGTNGSPSTAAARTVPPLPPAAAAAPTPTPPAPAAPAPPAAAAGASDSLRPLPLPPLLLPRRMVMITGVGLGPPCCAASCCFCSSKPLSGVADAEKACVAASCSCVGQSTT